MSTPGQIAYATWWRTRYGLEQADAGSAYQMLPAVDRQAWEAAAQAVLELRRLGHATVRYAERNKPS